MTNNQDVEGALPDPDEHHCINAAGVDIVDEASIDSFPAVDPPSWTPLHVGGIMRSGSPDAVDHRMRWIKRLRDKSTRLILGIRHATGRLTVASLLSVGGFSRKSPKQNECLIKASKTCSPRSGK